MTDIADPFESKVFSKDVTGMSGLADQARQGHLLDQYKLYVEMTDRISARRQSANSFFLTINTALVGFVIHSASTAANSYMWTLPFTGIVITFLWYRLICSYRDLNTAKFKIIHAMEKQLPASPYSTEWEAVAHGTNPVLYLPFTHIEAYVPWIFFSLHIFVFYRTIS